jgi:methylthioribose-1-phosphate isomerase
VNLFWAVDRLREETAGARRDGAGNGAVAERLETLARRIHEEDLESCHAIGRYGATLVPDGGSVLTHCNAGGLATAGYGTALGVVRGAVEAGKKVRVLADETRPFLQGARLTAWELMQDGIETVLITDNMAGSLMRRGEIDLVVVGSDRIAANGDIANKIGTYPVAVLAREHGIPFYVAAPLTTVDLNCPDGDNIPIEERDPSEVTEFFGTRVAPEGVGVMNPAFDVTPAEYVKAIVTDRGIARPPYKRSLRELFQP